MTFEENVRFYLTYYRSPTDLLSDEIPIQITREMLEERYEMQAHRPLPKSKEKIFAHLVAIQILLDYRANEAYASEMTVTEGAQSMKSMRVGDTTVEFGGDHRDGGYLNQNAILMDAFTDLWRTLIATTRRFRRW